MTPIVIILSLECLIKNCKISGRVIPPVFVHSYRNVYNIRSSTIGTVFIFYQYLILMYRLLWINRQSDKGLPIWYIK